MCACVWPTWHNTMHMQIKGGKEMVFGRFWQYNRTLKSPCCLSFVIWLFFCWRQTKLITSLSVAINLYFLDRLVSKLLLCITRALCSTYPKRSLAVVWTPCVSTCTGDTWSLIFYFIRREGLCCCSDVAAILIVRINFYLLPIRDICD